MIKICRLLLIMLFLLLGGCPAGEDNTTQERSGEDHVWQEQIRTLEKAQEVEQIIQTSADQYRQVIDEQSR